MGYISSLFQLFIILFSSPSTSSSSLHSQPQQIQSPRLLDLLIRDQTVNITARIKIKTGIPHTVPLPANFSGAAVSTIRLRCGSLYRYGVKIDEFHLPPGVYALPCVERLLLICESLGPNWFHLYKNTFNLTGYSIISPIVGIQAYNAGDDLNKSNPFELGITSVGKTPIKINFRNLVNSSNILRAEPYCMTFKNVNGKVDVAIAKMIEPFVCAAWRQGHFALVTVHKLPPPATQSPPRSNSSGPTEDIVRGSGGKASRWKVALGSSIGAALGAFLLGLLLIAMFVRAKQRTKTEEMARRAYQEEALQVSMVGHVKGPVAPANRTVPTGIDSRYRPPYV